RQHERRRRWTDIDGAPRGETQSARVARQLAAAKRAILCRVSATSTPIAPSAPVAALAAMRAPSPSLPLTPPWQRAPREGVTEPSFRDLVLARNDPRSLGGAFTEFVRVVERPIPTWKLREHLGPARFGQPVGVQLMGSDLAALAATARNACEAGAPLIDLTFGCPAKGALRGCAGSALLDHPERLEAVVRCVRAAVPELPVTAKIRAGSVDASRVEELARAAEAGGAALLTVHCRT